MTNIIKTALLAGAISLSSCNGGYNDQKSGVEEKTSKETTEVLNEVNEDEYKNFHRLYIKDIPQKVIEIEIILNETKKIFDKYELKDENQKDITIGNYNYRLRKTNETLGIIITDKSKNTQKEYFVDKINEDTDQPLHLWLREKKDNGLTEKTNRNRIELQITNGAKGYIKEKHYDQEGVGTYEENMEKVKEDFDELYNKIMESLQPL